MEFGSKLCADLLMEAKDEDEVEWKIIVKDDLMTVEFLDDVTDVRLYNLNNQQKTSKNNQTFRSVVCIHPSCEH